MQEVQSNSKHAAMQITPPEELTAPHFDDTAIAAARPVQPLPQRALREFSYVTSSRIAALIGAVVILTAATIVAFVIVALSPGTADTATSKAEVRLQAAEFSASTIPGDAKVDASLSIPDENRKSDIRRELQPLKSRVSRVPSVAAADDDDRPRARKVGEIRYTRSPNLP